MGEAVSRQLSVVGCCQSSVVCCLLVVVSCVLTRALCLSLASTLARTSGLFLCCGGEPAEEFHNLARRAARDADQLARRPVSGQDGNRVLRQAQVPRQKLNAGRVGLAFGGRRMKPQAQLAGWSQLQALLRGARLYLHPERYRVSLNAEGCFCQRVCW